MEDYRRRRKPIDLDLWYISYVCSFLNMLTQWIYKLLKHELSLGFCTGEKHEIHQVQILEHSSSLDSFLLSDGEYSIMACLDKDYASFMKTKWENDWDTLKYGIISLIKYHFFMASVYNGVNESRYV